MVKLVLAIVAIMMIAATMVLDPNPVAVCMLAMGFGVVAGLILAKEEAENITQSANDYYEAKLDTMRNALHMAIEEVLGAKDGMSRLAQLRRIFLKQEDVDRVLRDLADALGWEVERAIEIQKGNRQEEKSKSARELPLAKSEFWEAIRSAEDCGYKIRKDENGKMSWKLYLRDNFGENVMKSGIADEEEKEVS